MTPGHVESEAACAMCALTLAAPVRGTEMGVAAAGAGGCLCAQTRVDNAATNDPSSPWVCVSSFFFGSIRSIGNVDVLLYCRRSLVAHAQ